MLHYVPFFLVNSICYYSSYKISERMRINPLLALLALHKMTNVAYFSSYSADEFHTYDLAARTVLGYWAKRLDLKKVQKTNIGPVVSVIVSGIDVHCLLNMTIKMNSEVLWDYRDYSTPFDNGGGFSSNFWLGLFLIFISFYPSVALISWRCFSFLRLAALLLLWLCKRF